MAKRDNFSRKTIDILAKRVGYICSNPNCQSFTVGPSSNKEKALNIGVAAHIIAASPNGPRNDNSIESEERKSIENGIWLCQNCSVLIDRDENNYSIELLQKWKKNAEEYINESIGGRTKNNIYTLANKKNNLIETVKFTKSKGKGYYFKISKGKINEHIHFNTTHLNTEIYRNLNSIFTKLKEWFTDILEINHVNSIELIQKANLVFQEEGINGISELIFNHNNKENNIPKFSNFIDAFKQYSQLNKKDYFIDISNNALYLTTIDNEYIIHTYQGKYLELKLFIEDKLYNEIFTETNQMFWSEIYFISGIKKEEFIPCMLDYWENYWLEQYQYVQENIGTTEHLEFLKDKSWRQFNIFSECYNNTSDIIKLASELDDSIFYPLAVITMMKFYDNEGSFMEYCEHEFERDEWKSIFLENNNDKSLIFYIKAAE